ncbi:hypothetical protein N657DRAFT_375219 [Parathielavia appendiculata]|uniref:Uncharacterized protein n=1 Tax=Parathielavia appendiculata TaxID=2587402 RepID=A0AAN6TQM6_9PEZI|nr:hypothetical protein N657DRAFT_375219 [Parathielavia appendiculata]
MRHPSHTTLSILSLVIDGTCRTLFLQSALLYEVATSPRALLGLKPAFGHTSSSCWARLLLMSVQEQHLGWLRELFKVFPDVVHEIF